MVKLLLIVGLALAVLLLLTCSETVVERCFIFFPSRTLAARPEEFGLPVQEHFIATAAGRLHAWYLPPAGNGPVIFHCHGNGGNISHRLPLMTHWQARGVGFLLFDYRGYGLSAGQPSEAGVYQDAVAVYDFLVRELQVPPAKVVVQGHSLGGVVAMALAARRPVAGLILEATFARSADLARLHFFWLPTRWLWRRKFNAEPYLAALQMPKLVVHGQLDQIVPLALGTQLFAALPEPKDLYLIPGADHNDLDLVGGEDYYNRLEDFCRQATEKNLAN